MRLFNNTRWGRNCRPLRPGDNPLADQLIEENDRLRRERNDWMREAERLKRLVDQYEWTDAPAAIERMRERLEAHGFDGDRLVMRTHTVMLMDEDGNEYEHKSSHLCSPDCPHYFDGAGGADG